MISSVTVTNLRGIKTGTLSDLTPLTILVGPNGSGKSTVLDALSIGSAPNFGSAVADAVTRRPSRHPTFRWLFRGADVAAVVSTIRDGATRVVGLELKDPAFMSAQSTLRSEGMNSLGGVLATSFSDRFGGHRVAESPVWFNADGSFEAPLRIQNEGAWNALRTEVRFVDMRFGSSTAIPLNRVLTDAKTAGRFDSALSIAREVVPGLELIEILPMDAAGEVFDIFTTFKDRSVPLSVAGDGVRGLVRLCLELAAQRGGLVLVEEPEVHQHPKSLRLSARALAGALKQGVQVVIATHSLELIDYLIDSLASEGNLAALSVHRLLLEGGVLDARRFPGEQARRIRSELELELR